VAVLWDTKQALRNSVAKGSLAERVLLLSGALIARRKSIPSTVTAGSMQVPNSSKPYYYNGYYYAFYQSGLNLYYQKSADGKSWDAAVLIASVFARWAVMGIDNLILLSRVVSNYVTVRVGTIQSDGTIDWGSDAQLGYSDTRNRSCWCYATKIGSVRKLFVNATACDDNYPPAYAATDSLWVSDDDGGSWTFLQGCFRQWTSLFWLEIQAIPFNSDNKVQEIYSPGKPPTGAWYAISSVYRDGVTCQVYVDSQLLFIDDFRNQYYLDDQANAILIGDYVHLVYIDSANNLLHKRISYGGTWENVGTVKTNINADAGITLTYNPSTGLLYIIYYEATNIKFVTWDGTSYSSEQIIITNETDVNQLTAYPQPLNSKILLQWKDSANIRFALLNL